MRNASRNQRFDSSSSSRCYLADQSCSQAWVFPQFVNPHVAFLPVAAENRYSPSVGMKLADPAGSDRFHSTVGQDAYAVIQSIRIAGRPLECDVSIFPLQPVFACQSDTNVRRYVLSNFVTGFIALVFKNCSDKTSLTVALCGSGRR